MRNPSLPTMILWAEGFDWELVLLGTGLLVLLIIGFWMVMRVRRWQNEEQAERLTSAQQLEQYQSLLEEGLLAPEEFEKLRRKLDPSQPGANPPPPTRE